MDELSKLFHEVADSAVSLAKYAQESQPGTPIAECFPYESQNNLFLEGKFYRVRTIIEIKEMKW